MRFHSITLSFCVGLVLSAICFPAITQAGGTVSTCNEAGLNSALSGGGTVTFACDGAIRLTGLKTISADTILDGTGRSVILSASNTVQLFKVNSGVTLTLLNLTLADGKTTTNGGAIYNSGTVVASNCTFTGNTAVGTNGAAGSNGSGGGGTGGNGTAGKAGGPASGGAIYNLGSLSLTRCTFLTNAAAGGSGGLGGNGGSGTSQGGNGGGGGAGGNALGGAIYSTNSVSLTNCAFDGNAVIGGTGGSGGGANGGPFLGTEGNGAKGGDGSGSGLYALQSSTVIGCTFSSNTAQGGDAGTAGTNMVPITGNSGPTTGASGGNGGASLGGGFANLGTNNTVNCTFYSNSAAGGAAGDGGPGGTTGGDGGNGGKGSGGGLYSSGKTGVTNCTFSSGDVHGGPGGAAGSGPFAGNSGSAGAVQGANIANNAGTFALKNSIIAYKVSDGNGYGSPAISNGGNNISSDASIPLSGGGSMTSTDPLLTVLADNGGPTKTCALLPTSPAIDAGNDSAAPVADQRGYFRYLTSDIGAFEYAGQPASVRALGPVASLDGRVGLFMFFGPPNGTANPLTMSYAIGGTASNGVDYALITNSVTIPAGETYAVVLVKGMAGAFSGTSRTITVTMLPSPQYYLDPLLTQAEVMLSDHNSFDSSKRYARGSSTAADLQSLVIPVDFETGILLDPIGGNATNLFPGNRWTNSLYHFDATNTAYQDGIANRLLFQNPIVAFGNPVGGSSLYLNQSYSFGIYAGNCSANLAGALRIQAYYRSNSALAGTISLPLPDVTNTNALSAFLTNGFTVTAEQFGLRTTLLDTPDQRWGIHFGGAYILTHTASPAATNYYYVVEDQGYGGPQYLVLNQSGAVDWSRLYAMEFTPFPAGRSTFIDAPHFDGRPLPSAYQGKTVQELTSVVPTLPDLSSLISSNYLAIDGSPELRRHPILDQFVKDMGNDPLALANYVINEVGLTDAIDYDTNFNSQPSINLGGVDRSALATFQEGQGSPVEQCALLIYLLRQAGVPAAYIYPTNGGLQMLDSQVSKLLRTQLHGALDPLGQTNLPQLISVNYPWVAAYVGSNWVQVFPWLKDTEIVEGFDLYDYMPTNYNSGFKWLSHFVAGDTNIFSLSTSDQPLDLLPLFIQSALNTNYPGLSVDDMGVQLVNRRHLYAQWIDFPKPFSLSGPPLAIESLKTNLNLFNTVQIRAFSQANTNKFVDSSEMYLADLHNRKLLLKFIRFDTTNQHDMVLLLNPYSTNITSQTNFGATANPTWKLLSTNRLNSTDDIITFQVTHRRLRFLPSNYVAPHLSGLTNLWGYNYFEQGEQQEGKVYQFTDSSFRKGDLAAFCLDVGRVSQKMLNVHAQEIWNFNRNADTNQPSTLDPDVYQGTTAYLLGMSYFNYMDRFSDLNNRLHKIQQVSLYQHGFGLLRPLRDGSGNLYSNTVILTTPAVHMPNNGQAFIFNSTIHPDSGRDTESSQLDWWLQLGVQGSAAEHAVLRSYYQTNAISTVKLLQALGTNIVKLNADNYLGFGETTYHGVKLKNADTNVWNKVLTFFGGADVDRQAWLTPGVITNGTYAGVAALMFSYSEFIASVGGLDGGIANPFATNTWSPPNSVNNTVNPAPAGSATSYQWMGSPAINNPGVLVNGEAAFGSQPTVQAEVGNNQIHLDPSILEGGLQLAAYGFTVNSPSLYGTYYDSGLADTGSSSHGDKTTLVAEPVDTLTGGFYVDATDLSLPGPMPLQIRRNYESQNLAENEFGFGWKISYVPFLTLNTNSTLIFAAEMDGSNLAYRQNPTNANLWMPQAQDNLTLNNNSSMAIGSVGNLFNNKLTLSVPGGTNVYTLTGGDGSVRIFTQRSYAIGTFTRQRPYLDSWRDSRGNFYTFQYGTDSMQPDYGQVRRIQSSNGNFAGFYFDVYGHITEAYTGDGRRLQYEYDKFGDLVTVTLPDESQISYQYQHANYVTNSVTNVYSTHLIVQERKPDGRVLKNDYDSLRRVTNQYSTVGIDLSLVRNATFLYTNNFALGSTNLLTGTTTILDYTNRAMTYFYTNSLIRKIVDPLNQTVIQDWYETDTAGGFRRSLKSVTDKRGLQTAFSYDASGNLTNTTVTGDLLGDGSTTNAVTSATYNTNNLPLQIVDPATNSVGYVYDTNFPFLPQQVIKYAGAVAISTNFLTYVSVTNVLTVGTNQMTNAAFGILQRQIRAFGSPDAATNDVFCDGRGFPTNTVQYAGTGDANITNQCLYNGRGEVAQRTDAAGRTYRFAFDPMGRPTAREVFDTGQSQPIDWEYSYYNENGELTWSDGPRFDPEDYVWRDHDGGGRQTTELRWRSEAKADGTGVQAPTDGNLFATTFSQFDPFGNLVQVTDPRGNFTQMDCDAIGQVLRRRCYDSSGAGLATNSFGYEPGGEAAFITNALGGVTSKQYTQRGQLKAQSNPDGSTNHWTYYADGRPRREVQRNGAYWETTYNDANRKATRTFYSAAGSPGATNSTVLDRRGNAIQNLDAGFNLFTNLFDGLDRLKIAAGPAIATVVDTSPIPGSHNYVTNVLQQITTYLYDNAGKVLTVSNAVGEKTVTITDPIGRVLSAQIFPTNSSTPVRVATNVYAANHHSVTVTNGSGSAAIASTTFTDNDGHGVLSIAYPSANAREFTRSQHDLAGNQIYAERDSSTNGAITVWTTASYMFDGLNRMTASSDRDGAVTYFYRDAGGSVTNQILPGGTLKRQAVYNNAGQKLKEWSLGAGGVGTRTNTYSYYASGSPFAGLLQTRTDGRGTNCTHGYDDRLRLVTQDYGRFICNIAYDARGFMISMDDTPTGGSVFNDPLVWRGFDAYGQLIGETVWVSLELYSADQTWDAAGRRTGLGISDGNTSGFDYNYAWRADGLLSSVNGAAYTYNNAGLLNSRTVGARATAVSSRDGAGRPLSTSTTVNTVSKLTETLTYAGDGLLGAHTLAREDFTDSRAYAYTPLTRRLTNEVLNLDGTHRWTNSFTFDGGAPSGLGVLSKVAQDASGTNVWAGSADAFSRINSETNLATRRLASGRVNGPATVTVSVDGRPVPVGVAPASDHNWSFQWRSTLELTPGAHQLTASALHPSGMFTTNVSIWVTNNAANETVSDTFDGAGNVTLRIWKSPSGATNRTQTLSWDERGRLWEISDLDSSGNERDWFADYDPLGRRLYTSTLSYSNRVSVNGSLNSTISFFDPAVEFLELGVLVNYEQENWKLYGPDLNGVYGGMNGVGGLDAVTTDLGILQPTISDARGNVLAFYDPSTGTNTWTAARTTGYGSAPGYRPLPLTSSGNVAQSAAWRGRYSDITGYVLLGARYYNPESGSFLSADPVWNGRDPSYFSFCGGDPINVFDPDGRTGSTFESNPSNLEWRSADPTAPVSPFRARDVVGGFVDEMHGNAIGLFAPWSLDQLGANAAGATTAESGVYNRLQGGFREMYGNPMAKLGVADPNSSGYQLGEAGADVFAMYTVFESARYQMGGERSPSTPTPARSSSRIEYANWGGEFINDFPASVPMPAQKPPVVLGEDMMNRVIPFAEQHGFDYYKPGPSLGSQAANLAANRAWIEGMINEGRTFVDIGPAPGRLQLSPYYQMESGLINQNAAPAVSFGGFVKKP
jgi:RHS repeat-associated protein